MQVDASVAAYEDALTDSQHFTFPFKHREQIVQMLFITSYQHYLSNMDRFLYKVEHIFSEYLRHWC